MDDAHAAAAVGSPNVGPALELYDFGRGGIVTAGEDIHVVAQGRDVPGQLADIDVLAAGVDTAELRQGRGVLADECDASRHAYLPAPGNVLISGSWPRTASSGGGAQAAPGKCTV